MSHVESSRTPALIGCFVVDRLYFEEIGLLDEGMEVYGGENVELGVRVSNGVASWRRRPCSGNGCDPGELAMIMTQGVLAARVYGIPSVLFQEVNLTYRRGVSWLEAMCCVYLEHIS